jgi:uncharacterized protein (TIGR02246 family)
MEASEAVVDAIIELVAAWNSSDAPAFSALFTEQAQYIGADRISRRGRAQIEEIIRLPAARVRVSIDGPVSVRFDVGGASVRFRWTTELADKGRRGTIDCRMVKRGDGWRIELLHNADEAGESA